MCLEGRRQAPAFAAILRDARKRSLLRMRTESKQIELFRALERRRERIGRELELAPVEAEPLACRLEAASDHPGDRPGAGHALAPLAVIVLAAAHVLDELEHVAMAIGEMLP